jgi:hypothetical protein
MLPAPRIRPVLVSLLPGRSLRPLGSRQRLGGFRGGPLQVFFVVPGHCTLGQRAIYFSPFFMVGGPSALGRRQPLYIADDRSCPTLRPPRSEAQPGRFA